MLKMLRTSVNSILFLQYNFNDRISYGTHAMRLIPPQNATSESEMLQIITLIMLVKHVDFI